MKGFFTQGVVVLFEQPPSLDLLASVLTLPILKRTEETTSWEFGGPTLVVGFRPEVNGLIAVDVVSSSWPDDMGSPTDGSMVFGAWSMGHFGPFAYPGNLQRACQQAWSWDGGPTAVVDRHQAFVRIRLSYVFGLAKDAKVMPPDYDAQAELDKVVSVAQAVSRCEGALAYFNPNGEVLMSPRELEDTLAFAAEHGRVAVETWSNVRMFNLTGLADGWMLMDSIGLAQIDLPDLEAVFPSRAFEPNEVANFLRNISLYVAGRGDVFQEGHTADGPGDMRWRARRFEHGLSDPPRDTVRFFPDTGPNPPAALTKKTAPPS